MNIQDDKKRERIYTHHKTLLNKKKLISKLSGWNLKRLNNVLASLQQKELIEIAGTEVKIFIIPISHKEFIDVNNKTRHISSLTEEESKLLTLLSMQSIVC